MDQSTSNAKNILGFVLIVLWANLGRLFSVFAIAAIFQDKLILELLFVSCGRNLHDIRREHVFFLANLVLFNGILQKITHVR